MSQLPPGIDLENTPTQPPPDGVIPDFDKPATLKDTTIIIVSIVTFVNLFFLSIRIFTKFKTKKRIVIDDWCAILATILSIGLGAVLILGRDGGKHTWNMSLAQAFDPRAAKIIFSQAMLVGPTVYMGKVVFLTLYHRIFGHIEWVPWTIYAAAVVGLTIPAMTPLDAVVCSPPKGSSWGVQNPECPKSFKYGIPQGVASLVIDVYIMVLPIPIIARLNLNRRKKIGVMLIFLMGILAVIADVIVMKYRVDMQRGWDTAYAGYVIILCSVVETSISVACSSMPTIAQFSRLHIWQSEYFLSLRSLLRSATRRSHGSGLSSRTSSKAKSAEKPPKAFAKRPDPYSIGMPTTMDESVTYLTLDGGENVELGDYGNARLQPDMRSQTVEGGEETVGQGIQKTPGMEQMHGENGAYLPRDLV